MSPINPILFYLCSAIVVVASVVAIVAVRPLLVLPSLLLLSIGIAGILAQLGSPSVALVVVVALGVVVPLLLLYGFARTSGPPPEGGEQPVGARVPIGIVAAVAPAVMMTMVAWGDPSWRRAQPPVGDDLTAALGADVVLLAFAVLALAGAAVLAVATARSSISQP